MGKCFGCGRARLFLLGVACMTLCAVVLFSEGSLQKESPVAARTFSTTSHSSDKTGGEVEHATPTSSDAGG